MRLEAMSGLERLAEMMENPVGDDDTDRGLRKFSVPIVQWFAAGMFKFCTQPRACIAVPDVRGLQVFATPRAQDQRAVKGLLGN